MDTRAIVKATGFLVLTVISIPSNLLIFFTFLHIRLTEGKLMPADIILCQLSLANLMLAFSRSFPQMLTAFGCKNLFDDIGCKLVIFFFRVSRSLSINLTCLLSTYQAVLLSPATSRLDSLKMRIPKYLQLIFVCLCVFSMLTSVHPIIFCSSRLINNTVPPYTFNYEYCFVTYPDSMTFISIGLSLFFKDFAFIVMMVIMSCYILLLLYQHSKKVKILRCSDQRHSGNRAETKASRAVVTLVILYFLIFGVDNAIWLYSLSTVRVLPIISDIRVFFSVLYTSVCPVVVIITNPRVKVKLKEGQPKRSSSSSSLADTISSGV
ncbi:olfactory receptor class A-like protein 1 [Erpetoichthys calabaricus]|uniref:olfactory receptor class A-like protein 1 n=1 Tax=Erpetoichthys calabaricus TaxID=27687 RepID=UPI002234034D|nr:olfactory receptor class A-like protein 1 [Erpetoichthys calabaricus]